MFSAQIEKLTEQAEAAERRGDRSKAAKTRESIKTYTEWLAQAQKTSTSSAPEPAIAGQPPWLTR